VEYALGIMTDAEGEAPRGVRALGGGLPVFNSRDDWLLKIFNLSEDRWTSSWG